MAVYFWKRKLPVSAQMAGEYLEELEKKHSALTPEIVLEESREENAVLHKCFEWDDTKATEGYELENIFSNLETKFEMFIQSMKDSNDKRDAEMRDRDNQH